MVDHLVQDDPVPWFRFFDNSGLMGEDRNDVMDWNGNNTE